MKGLSKVIKIVIGIILLGISAFYLLGVCLVIADAEKDASYSLKSYLVVEQTDCEYAGENPIINGREENADEGYGFYKITLEARNLSSVPYYGGLFEILDIDRGSDDQDVRLMVLPPVSGQPGYFSTAAPAFPGKTTVELVYYLEIREGVDVINSTYRPNWDEEPVTLELMLDR